MGSFTDWLSGKLAEKDWSMRKLAGESGLSHALISYVMSGQQAPTRDFCAAIAPALGVSEWEVTWRAGLTEEVPPYLNADIHALIAEANALSPEQRKFILAIVRALKSGAGVVITPAKEGARYDSSGD